MKGRYVPHLKTFFIKLLMCLALVLPLWFLTNTITYSAEDDIIDVDSIPGYMVYIDSNNNICIETYDLEKASDIYYRTIGFTISRCAPGEARLINGVDSEYVDMLLYSELLTSQRERYKGKIYEHNIFRIPMEDLLTQIRRAGVDNPSYLDWIAEIENYYYHRSETVCYLKFDCIMTTVNESKLPKQEGIITNLSNYHFGFSGKVYFNRPIDNGANPTAIQNAYAWRDRRGLESHFNKYLSLGDTNVSPSVPVIPDSPVALYETKNYSSIFDISTAIPSGEEVTNVISAAAFTGNDLEIAQNTVSRGGYSATYQYYIKKVETVVTKTYVTTLNPGNSIVEQIQLSIYMGNNQFEVINNYNGTYSVYRKDYSTNEVSELVATKTFNYKAEVSYQYVSAAPQLYEFNSMTVRNQAFPGGDIMDRKLTYTAAELNMPDINVLMYLYNKESVAMGQPHLTIRDGMSEVNGFDYSPAGEGYHYKFASEFDYPYHTYTTYITDMSQLNEAVKNDRLTEAGKIANNCWSRNDYVSINDGEKNFVLMKNDQVTGANVIDADSGVLLVSRTTAATGSTAYGVEYSMAKINEDLLARRVAGTKTVEIPIETDNANFPTSCECTWKSIFADSEDTLTLYAGKNIYDGAGVDDIYEHVMDGGRGPNHRDGDMYPIRVHTPIISPIKIVNPDKTVAVEQTQLIAGYSYNAFVENQLLLDRSYFISWENKDWLSALYGDVKGYDDVLNRYTKDKWVRFPFDVMYNNTLYEIDEDSGYTEWIKVVRPDDYETPYDEGVDVSSYQSANHWQMTPFYIPSFAQEGGEPGNSIYIECKVEAWNVLGRDLGNHTSAVQLDGNMNSMTESYVASARKDVQLSGWIYDFSVVGSNNTGMYTGEGLLDAGSAVEMITNTVSFAAMKEEKKTGTLNRLGLPNIRYLTDGSLTDAWDPLNTIPLRNGQSDSFSKMGNVWLGQYFAFTIKTISNLSGPNDALHITPTLTYVTSDGEVLSSENGDFQIVIIENHKPVYTYNPDDWSLQRGTKFCLNNGALKESFYDTKDTNPYQFGDWLTSSVTNENAYSTGYEDMVSDQVYWNREVTTYDLSHIYIPSSLRYVSGEYEQLGINQNRQYIRGGTSSLFTYDGISGYGANQQWKFITSMQQWQSAYSIPENIKIIDTRNRGGKDFSILEYMNEKGGITDDDEIFEELDGYLVINFDIVAYKDGEPYLEYSGGYDGATNMWDKEGFTEGTVPGDPDDGPEIPIKDGDVAIVELDRRMRHYYEAAIMNIN